MSTKVGLFVMIGGISSAGLGTLVLGCKTSASRTESHAESLVGNAAEIPVVSRISVGTALIWSAGEAAPTLSAGQEVILEGRNFGSGPDVDLSKIVIGQARALERDLPVYRGKLDFANSVFREDLYEETSELVEVWKKDIKSWTPTKIVFTVPTTTNAGPLVVSVQKYHGLLPIPGGTAPMRTEDSILSRVVGLEQPLSNATIGIPDAPLVSAPVDVKINNPAFQASAQRGAADFWLYDYNLGVNHLLAGVDWETIFAGRAIDPVTGERADPEKLFGAIKIREGEVPAFATQPYRFDPYPIPNPIRTLTQSPLLKGSTYPTGWIGYVYADGRNPLAINQLHPEGKWIGFNCISCHARRIEYEDDSGRAVNKVFAGLPNVNWSLKWATLGHMKGLKGLEKGPGEIVARPIDKTQLVYALPEGTTEATLLKSSLLGGFSNDFLYSPVAIPILTRHPVLRRSLSRSEGIAGFEGSYLHPQEPDGTMGAMHISDLKDLTAYMTTLDSDHDLLTKIGIFNWLKHKGKLSEIGGVRQSEFNRRGVAAFPELAAKIEAGKTIFVRDCQRCHQPNLGTNTDEAMVSLTEVGSYFSPSAWNLKVGSLRTAMLHDLYWVQGRGMLHDGHLRSEDKEHQDSVELLLHPDRCNQNSDLYRKLYTINDKTFKVKKGDIPQTLATRQQSYFVEFPGGGTAEQQSYLYWDFQKMRSSFGPREMHLERAVELPATPHPWCAKTVEEIEPLLHYLWTL